MKLVIDIDDKTYKMIKDGLFLIKGGRGSGRIMEYNALKSIYDGKPLPEGHGRLIDVDALEPDTEWDDYYDGFISFSPAQIDNAPTIIEADKENAE